MTSSNVAVIGLGSAGFVRRALAGALGPFHRRRRGITLRNLSLILLSSVVPLGAARADEPKDSVEIIQLGMHIGGGPNDEATKEPIRSSVAPHFEAFRQCFTRVERRTDGDYGVDLRIPAGGGKPKDVSQPRTSLKGEEFKTCMLRAFQQIDFQKPRLGETVVSYSVRFMVSRRLK